MPLSTDDRFNLEVLKLLLKVAGTDGTVDGREVALVYGAGRSWLVPEPELRSLVEAARKGHDVAEPDFALLRTRKDEVLTAVRAMVASDGVVQVEETSLLRAIVAALA
jgi:uncharacterized membrane protein YebE (DUF533 family)